MDLFNIIIHFFLHMFQPYHFLLLSGQKESIKKRPVDEALLLLGRRDHVGNRLYVWRVWNKFSRDLRRGSKTCKLCNIHTHTLQYGIFNYFG